MYIVQKKGTSKRNSGEKPQTKKGKESIARGPRYLAKISQMVKVGDANRAVKKEGKARPRADLHLTKERTLSSRWAASPKTTNVSEQEKGGEPGSDQKA